MDIRTIQEKILSDREYIFARRYVRRDFSFRELPGMAVIIVGARRSGKTSLLRSYARTLVDGGLPKEKICYINFFEGAEGLTIPLVEKAYFELYPGLQDDKDVRFLFDEVQNVEEWGRGVSVLMDRHPCHVVLTGSSAKYLSVDIADEMRGRGLVHPFYPLSFREFCRFNGTEVPNVGVYPVSMRNTLSNLYSSYLARGSYPALAAVDDDGLRQMVLGDYFDLAYSRDIIDRFEVTKGTLLRRLLFRLVKNSGSPYTVARLVHMLRSEGFSTSAELVSTYIGMIKDTKFMEEVEIYGTETEKRRNPRKLYAVDHQMAVLFREFGWSEGVVLEHAVFSALLRTGMRISYYRDADGYETDFVVSDISMVPKALVQVTCRLEGNREREVRGLRSAMSAFGLKRGVIVTMDEEEREECEEGMIEIVRGWRFSLDPELLIWGR